MAGTTRLIGLVLTILGIATFYGTGQTSKTALIPAAFGAVLLVLAWVARNESARRHAMHVAMVVALLGILGTASRLVPGMINGSIDFARVAVWSQVVTVVLLVYLLVKGIQSFKAARLARTGGA